MKRKLALAQHPMYLLIREDSAMCGADTTLGSARH